MKIKLSYDAKTDIPTGFEDLYTEKDGKFALTGVEGMKSQEDINRIQAGLVLERTDHKKTKDKLATIVAVLGDLKPEDVVAKLDLVDELQAKVDAKGKDGAPDEAAIERIVETRVKRALAPVERERDGLKKQVGDLTVERDSLGGTIRKGKLEDQVRSAAVALKVLGPAVDDVLLNANQLFEIDEATGKAMTKDNVGVTPGLSPDVWLKDMQEKRPHWWPASQGGGALGSGKDGGKSVMGNPWSPANWNLTHQGQYIREHGAEKASLMAAQAGTKVGGPMAKAAR